MKQPNPGQSADQPRRRGAVPLDRRGFLRLTGAAGTLGAMGATGPLLAACSSTSGGHITGGRTGTRIKEYVPGPQPVSGGRYGGTVKVAWTDPPNSFDPALGENLTAWDCLTELVYFGSLMAYDKQFGGPVPNLAAGPPLISKDGKTLTFKIRPDVKFHNGRTIVAADFKYAWERMLDPKMQSWGASYLSSVVGASAVMGGKTKKLDGVETQGDSTLIVHLTAPDFTILNALTQPITAPVPSEEVARLGKNFGQTPVGYGPFKIVSYDSAAQTARFEKNPDYFYPGLPYLSAVEYHWGIDEQIQLLQLEHGETPRRARCSRRRP
jgi:ABC-type transport system substrate-binding protein